MKVLYWSLYGEVACAKHAPSPLSDAWHRDGWRPIRPESLPAGVRLACVICGEIALATRVAEVVSRA